MVLPNLCLVIPTSNQDGPQAKNRKKGDEILIVHLIFSSETTSWCQNNGDKLWTK
jgi:hypothetical protein